MGLKQRIYNGEAVMGTMITMVDRPDIVRVLARAGFDFAVVDCEHGAFTTRETADIIAVAAGIGFPVIVRMPEMRREHALKYIEMGATGLLLPNTETREQAQMLVDCAKYAPLGHRGVSLSRPHSGFQKITDGKAYMQSANDETILMCQIESGPGVDNAEAIAAVEGIDCLLIGPNDMSQSYGILNQFEHPQMIGSFDAVIRAAQTNGKVSGVHFGSAGPLKPWLSRGMRMNMCGSDVSMLLSGARAIFTDLGL